MNNLQAEIDTINSFASFFDAVGDYKSADECNEILVKISKLQSSNTRLSFDLRNLGFQKPLNWLIDQGKKLDRWVREKVPGGWVTVVIVAAGAGAFGPGIQSQLTGFFSKGGRLEQLLNSESPLDRAVGKTLLDTAQKQVSNATQPGQNRSIVTTPGQNQPVAQPGQNSYPTLYQDVSQVVTQVKGNRSIDIQQTINAKKTAIQNFFKMDPNYGNQQANNFEMIVKNQIKNDPSLANDPRVKGLK